MGLDIYHMLASEGDRGAPCIIAPDLPALRDLAPFFRAQENDYIDWDRMFAGRGLAASDYSLRSRRMSGSKDEYGFVLAAEAADIDAPIRVVFGRANAAIGCIRTATGRLFGRGMQAFYGPFLMRKKLDTVIYAENIGYQRGAVVDEFYEEFPPDDFVTDPALVRRIHALTLPGNRASFQQEFLDNWMSGRSFVLISW